MRRSLLLFRRLRCFFEADSRTPFRHSPLREETAFREKPHFPCKGSSPPLFLLPSRRNPSPSVRPPSLSAAYRRSASTQPATHRKPCFRHDVFASRPSFQPEHRSIRLEKPCIETVQEKTRKRGVSPTPLFPAPLRSPPCPMDSDRRRPGPGQKRSLAKYRKARFYGFPTNRLRPQSLRSRALPAGASDEHRRGNGRKESKEGFPCEKIGKPTDHPSPNLPTNVCDFELPQSRILRQPEFRCVPNRKPSGKAPHEIPLNRSDPPAARRNVSGSGSRKPSLSLSQTGRSSSEPEPQEKALRNTENRPDSPAARQTVSGSGLRKQSLSFARTGRSSSEPKPQEKALRNTESRPDSPATRRNVSGSGSRKPSLSLSRTGRSSSEPEPQEKALRNTENRPDSPAARRNVFGSGLRKQSLSFEGTFPDEIRTGSRRRVPRQDGKRSASPDRQQPSPSEHAPLRKTCAPREHNGSRGARVIRRTARDRSRHRPVALRSGSVRS